MCASLEKHTYQHIDINYLSRIIIKIKHDQTMKVIERSGRSVVERYPMMPRCNRRLNLNKLASFIFLTVLSHEYCIFSLFVETERQIGESYRHWQIQNYRISYLKLICYPLDKNTSGQSLLRPQFFSLPIYCFDFISAWIMQKPCKRIFLTSRPISTILPLAVRTHL